MFYSRWQTNGRFFLRLLFTAVFLLPIFWMLMASLMPTGVPLPTTFRLIPNPATFENYGRIWQIVPFGRFLLNSLLVVMTAVPITIMTSSWAGFAMSQLPDRRQRAVNSPVTAYLNGAQHRPVDHPLYAVPLAGHS